MTGNEVGNQGTKVLSEGVKVNTTLTSLGLRCEGERNENERMNECYSTRKRARC